MDLYRITHPLRLAKGSHLPGSGKGCAMNVISYINGDAQVTDFPTCSARPLSLLVQSSNDLLAGADGYLSPDHSVVALDLAWQTVGTADVPDTVVHAWVAELLTDPVWGVLRVRQDHRAQSDPRRCRTAPRRRVWRHAARRRLGCRRPHRPRGGHRRSATPECAPPRPRPSRPHSSTTTS